MVKKLVHKKYKKKLWVKHIMIAIHTVSYI